MTVTSGTVLTDALLQRCRERAAGYDRENRFCQEDFDELKAAGYLNLTLPQEFGGLGYTLNQYTREARRLAQYAPATALCLNMHHYWVGTAADSWRAGDKSVRFILEDAGAGEVFAAGHAESGNETSIVMSITKAEKVDGGYKFTGRKSFGSLSPVWTRFGLHGMDTSDPANPKVVHGFLARGASGVTIKDTWDVMSMRATRSDDTILDGAFVPDSHIARVVPAGLAGADFFVLSIFAWALMGFGNIYYGLAQRLLELTVEQVKSKGSLGMTRSMAHHPYVQHGVAEMVMGLQAIGAQLESVTGDWSAGVQHPDWPIRIVATKYNAVETAWKIADRALEVSGGFGMFKKSEMERLFRDARAGRFHPANSSLAHELIGKLALGVNPDDPQRWG
ncbi:MAG TPA: acyl-CoA dehydrogenase family protein [Vicinamibacterales bacterium]|nr:acyl-CoA dehydrogenase family protein [Vicinamibacterales bacterium]